MNDPTPAHSFVRPGQVHAHIPAPDNCVECGQPEAAHTPSTPAGHYAAAAADADARLDDELLGLRYRAEQGDITAAEAATLRVGLLENHLSRITALREIYFGDAGDGGWNSGTCSTE